MQYLVSTELQVAFLDLQKWAKENNEDQYPTPMDVEKFAKRHEVPEKELGALFGLLSRKERGCQQEVWYDAMRSPEHLSEATMKLHTRRQLVLFGLFRMFGDAKSGDDMKVLLV